MSVKKRKYSSEFKAKVVMNLISGDQTMAQICSKYQVSDKSVTAWKKKFLSNASMAFDIDHAVSDYKAEIAEKTRAVNDLHRQLGRRTAELEWASKKLKSLDFDHKKQMIKFELHSDDQLSVLKRCKLMGFNRSSFYYPNSAGPAEKLALMESIEEIYSKCPFYGYRKIHQHLLQSGFYIGVNRVNKYMNEMDLHAIYPKKKACITEADAAHKKYPYLLRELEINRANQVWSTDISYVHVNGGTAFLAAIIDWFSKAILSWKISASMDENLVMDVLNRALEDYGKPEIFNTDQGSQYTGRAHTERLDEMDIQISMDGKGRATDNVVIERFWRSAKYEDIYLQRYETLSELRHGMRQYIHFYNEKRFHQTLNYKKPMNVYRESMNMENRKAA